MKGIAVGNVNPINAKVQDPDVDYETEKTQPIYDENGKKTDYGMSLVGGGTQKKQSISYQNHYEALKLANMGSNNSMKFEQSKHASNINLQTQKIQEQ